MKINGWMVMGLCALAPAMGGCTAQTRVVATDAPVATHATEAAQAAVATHATEAAHAAAATHAADDSLECVEPAAKPEAKGKTSRADVRSVARKVAANIVLPQVWIYARAPRSASVMPPGPDAAFVDRLFAGRADEPEIDGLTLTSPAEETETGAPSAKIALDLPALRAEAGAITMPEPAGDLPLPEARPKDDPRLPRSAVGDVLAMRRGALQVCYGSAARLDPWLPGTAEVAFEIGKTGRVDHVKAHIDGLDRSPASLCMRKVVSSLAFAPPDQPIDVRERFDAAPAPSTRGATIRRAGRAGGRGA